MLQVGQDSGNVLKSEPMCAEANRAVGTALHKLRI